MLEPIERRRRQVKSYQRLHVLSRIIERQTISQKLSTSRPVIANLSRCFRSPRCWFNCGLRLNHHKILFIHRTLSPLNRYTSKSKNKICIIIFIGRVLKSSRRCSFFLRAFLLLSFFYCVYVDSLLTFPPLAHLRLAITRNCKLYSYHEKALRLAWLLS